MCAPDGRRGVVLEEKAHGALHLTENRGYRNRVAVVAYPVLFTDGEVRFFIADALDKLD